jgi:DNA-binding beta-propeller fold protein YncE
VNVENSVTSITVTASKSDAYTNISIDSTNYPSGTPASKTIDDLVVGNTNVSIEVTAENGSTKTYTITVNRARSSNANLTELTVNQGTLNPGFSAGTTAYTAGIVVDPAGNDITVTAAKSDPYTKISIAGMDYNAGTDAEKTVSLSPGRNEIPVTVTAEDGTSTKTYTIRVTVYGVITLAGSGTSGFNDGTGMEAEFYEPSGVAVDSDGNVYVSDMTSIRKITPAGEVSTIAGSGIGYADGPGTSAQFFLPRGVAVDSEGNVYVADMYNQRIRKIDLNGVVSTIAGSGIGYADGPGMEAKFHEPSGVAVDISGNVYVADTYNHRIRKIVIATGQVSTLAGSGSSGYADGTGVAAHFRDPYDVAVDSSGNFLYVADTNNQRIRKIVIATGQVSTLAGSGSSGYADGTVTMAQFASPWGVAVDSSGNVLYVADTNNHRIRKIVIATGEVTTLAGSGTNGFLDGDFLTANFEYPYGVAVDSSGNVYVADRNNHRIRKIIPAP